MAPKTPDSSRPGWTFISNHGNVLLTIARNPDATLREVAVLVGITERAVQRIVADLEAGHYLERIRSGRRNRYKIHSELPLRHPITSHRDIGALIELVFDPPPGDGDSLSLSVIATDESGEISASAEGSRPAPLAVVNAVTRDAIG